MKPRLFVGSSREGVEVAYAMQTNLRRDAEVTVWTENVFQPSEYVLESLLGALEWADIGVFVFSADDTLLMRGTDRAAVRDNVIFEFGMFVGRLGRKRSFIVAPESEDLHLPSDLMGVTVLEYEANRSDENWEAALGDASNTLRRHVKRLGPKSRELEELELPVFERRDLLTSKQRELLRAIEKQPERTYDYLRERFVPRMMTESELHYRLEQLRLLKLIRRSGGDDESGRPEVWFLDDAYRAAYEARVVRDLGSRRAP